MLKLQVPANVLQKKIHVNVEQDANVKNQAITPNVNAATTANVSQFKIHVSVELGACVNKLATSRSASAAKTANVI